MQESQNISQLIERSIYSIPKTPKIIILNDQEGELFILVQEHNQTISQHITKISLITDLLEFIRQISVTIESLSKKYGHFHITETMIGLNKHSEIITWINE
jgi:hypothetical protein